MNEEEEETTENRIDLYVRIRDYTANITRKERTMFEHSSIHCSSKNKSTQKEKNNINRSSAKQNYEYEKTK